LLFSSWVKIVSGGTPSSSVDEYWNGDINWATLVDLPQSEFISVINSTERKITGEGLKNSSAKMLPVNSVIVSTRATIGRIAINEVECSTNQGFKNIIINDFAKANTYFVALMMTRLIDKMNAMATGGTFKELSTANFKTLQIPLPPISIQQAIVAEIEGYQKIINGAKAIVAHYKPKIDINPDWELVELGEVCEITSSKRIFKDEYVESGVPFYRTKEIVELSNDLNPSLELFISEKRYQDIKEKFDIPKQGDILVSAVGTLGVSWIVNHDKPFYFKDGNLVWIKNLNEKVNPTFIKQVLDVFIPNQIHVLSAGAAYKALTIVKLKQLQIPLPDLETQRQIVAQIEKEQALVNANKQLIEIFEQKIKDRIAKVWGVEKTEEATLSRAAEPATEYLKN
jgi:type I restriction enzyme M protein